MTPPRQQSASRNTERQARITGRKLSYHLPELGAVSYVIAAAATLPVPAAAAAIAVPAVADVAVKAKTGRGKLRNLHDTARVRRRWTRAVVRGGAANRPPLHSLELDDPYGPRPARVERVPAGHRIRLRSPKGFDELIANQGKVEGLLGCRIQLAVDPINPSVGTVTLVERDALRDLDPLRWPSANADTASVWDPLPFGIDDDHQPIYLDGIGHGHILVGGVTGSGKTVVMNLLIAQAALDPTCKLTIIDGAGGVDYIPWATAATLVDEAIDRAVNALEAIRNEIRATGAQLKANNTERVTPTLCGPTTDPDAIHTHRIVLDEAGSYFNHRDQQAARDFTNLYRELIQLGRKFGLQFVLGMQRPSATSISTDVRSQFAYRIGLRTADSETTRMLFPETDAPRCHVLGKKGYAGVGYVKAEGGGFIRAKTYYLDRRELDAIAARIRDRELDDFRRTPDDLTATIEPAPPRRFYDVTDTGAAWEYPGENPPPIANEPSAPSAPDTRGRDSFDRIIDENWGTPEPPPPTPPTPPQAPTGAAGGDVIPAPSPTGAGSPTFTPHDLTALLRCLVDAPDGKAVRRDYLSARLKRRAPRWYVALRDVAIPEGLVAVRNERTGRGGRPPKLYSLTDAGRARLREAGPDD